MAKPESEEIDYSTILPKSLEEKLAHTSAAGKEVAKKASQWGAVVRNSKSSLGEKAIVGAALRKAATELRILAERPVPNPFKGLHTPQVGFDTLAEITAKRRA
jgi:hypothetical protein